MAQCKHISYKMLSASVGEYYCEKKKQFIYECRGCFHWEAPIARSWFKENDEMKTIEVKTGTYEEPKYAKKVPTKIRR